MGYGYKYGYGVRRGGALAPCLTYAVSQPYLFNSDATLFLDKDTVRAADCLIKSNCHFFDGGSIETIYNAIVHSIGSLDIFYSLDNILWEMWSTGDLAVNGFFHIDLINNKFVWGSDAAKNRFIGWIGKTVFKNTNGDTILTFNFSENYTSSYNTISSLNLIDGINNLVDENNNLINSL